MCDWLFIISNDDDQVEAADCGSQKAFHSATERGNSCMSQAYARTLGMTIQNGGSTEWTPIRSVMFRPIFLITSIITDRIGRHEVLLPINHNL